MCFLALAYKVVPEYSVVVAANRDEYYDRPSEPPREVLTGVWAGVDRRAGGTWLGVNQHAQVVGVANLRSDDPPNPAAKSRGLLCLALLAPKNGCTEITEILRREIQEQIYNDFNLLVADPGNAMVATWIRSGGLTVRILEPGIHVVGNSLPDSLKDPKVARGKQVVATVRNLKQALDNLKIVCRDHGVKPDGTDAICVHGQQHGTRSSTLLALHDIDPIRHVYLFAEGKPCSSEYRDFAALIRRGGQPFSDPKGHDKENRSHCQ